MLLQSRARWCLHQLPPSPPQLALLPQVQTIVPAPPPSSQSPSQPQTVASPPPPQPQTAMPPPPPPPQLQMFPKMVREFEKGSNPPDAGISTMWRSLGKKNRQDASTIKGKVVPSSARNAKSSMAKEGSGTIFGGQHHLSQTLASVEFVKEMMEQDSPECPL